MPTPDAIIGHKKQLLQMEQDLATDNVSHAYLFAGGKGLGKVPMARWFARRLLTDGLSADDKTEALRRIDNLTHPDFLVLDQLWMEDRQEDWDVIARTSNVPQQHRAKAGLKTDIIGIDDVREIQQRLQETGEGKRRVCIIRKVERMQDSAANSFLKILEEPPEGRVFLLTTEAASSLLPTLLSRTRVIRLERTGDRELRSILGDMDEADASFIMHLAQGAPGMAIRLKQDPDLLREAKLLHMAASAFWNAPTLLERLKHLEPLHERGPAAEQFLFHLALALRQHRGDVTRHHRFLTELVSGLKTNAHRQLLAQKFASSVMAGAR